MLLTDRSCGTCSRQRDQGPAKQKERMKISELIEILEKVKDKHGDIEVTKTSNKEFDGIRCDDVFRRGERDVRGFNAEYLS
jgi:hypothetical protein